jgi:hypothetical protein
MEKYGKVIDNDLNLDNLTERGLTYSTSLPEALELINNNVNIEKRYDRKVDFNQFVGWDQQASWNILLDKLFSDYTVKMIQNKTAYYLDGVDKKGRRIMPSENVVENKQNAKVDEAEMQKHWLTFAERFNKSGGHQIYTTLMMNKPTLLNDQEIELVIHNKAQEVVLQDEKSTILEYLREQLKNDHLNLQTRIVDLSGA